MTTQAEYTIDELMAVCISRQIEDGEFVAQGIATPLVVAGYMLARLTHAPDVVFISAIGQSLVRDWGPLGVASIEALWNERGFYALDFVQAACDILPRFGPKEFFRPGQVDAWGNFNNVYIGGTYERPRLRLPGAGGIPDVTVHEEHVCLYVPRHGRHTFVEQLDFRSGLGHHPSRTRGCGPRYLVSDLGQFDFSGENGRMRLLSLHPGVTQERVQAKTGFALAIPETLPQTEPPTATELQLLRQWIDPLGVRMLETLSGQRRRQKLREILQQEQQQKADQLFAR
jgi:acyl CoA:acetate/3-ketoacid CoA transferase beta subunit